MCKTKWCSGKTDGTQKRSAFENHLQEGGSCKKNRSTQGGRRDKMSEKHDGRTKKRH